MSSMSYLSIFSQLTKLGCLRKMGLLLLKRGLSNTDMDPSSFLHDHQALVVTRGDSCGTVGSGSAWQLMISDLGNHHIEPIRCSHRSYSYIKINKMESIRWATSKAEYFNGYQVILSWGNATASRTDKEIIFSNCQAPSYCHTQWPIMMDGNF